MRRGSGRDPRTPRIEPVVLKDLRDGDPGLLVGGARLDGLRITGPGEAGKDLTDLALDECRLEGSCWTTAASTARGSATAWWTA